MICTAHAEVTVENRDYSHKRYFIQAQVEGADYRDCRNKAMACLWNAINRVLVPDIDGSIIRIDITSVR